MGDTTLDSEVLNVCTIKAQKTLWFLEDGGPSSIVDRQHRISFDVGVGGKGDETIILIATRI